MQRERWQRNVTDLHDKAGILWLEVKISKRLYLWMHCSRLFDIDENGSRQRLIAGISYGLWAWRHASITAVNGYGLEPIAIAKVLGITKVT